MPTPKMLREHLAELCHRCLIGASEEHLREVLDELDGPTLQRLGNVDCSNLPLLAAAAERVMASIPEKGFPPRLARLHYIRDLARIYKLITKRSPGRSVHDGEQGQFLAFVKAALAPVPPLTQGCEEDIRRALAELKKG